MRLNREEGEDLCRMQGSRCQYCGESVEVLHQKGNWVIDKTSHLIICVPCNRIKMKRSDEEFRDEIKKQVGRCRLTSPNYRIAEKYGVVKEQVIDIVFHFEKVLQGK